MNKWVGVGRPVRDPEVRYSQGTNPIAIARYTLAVNRTFKRDNEPDADFINCIVFGKSAEFAEKWFKQGTKIIVSGRIQTGSYTNKDGKKVYTTEVVVEEQEFAESKSNGEREQQTQKTASSQPSGDGFMNIPEGMDEELPFN